MNSNQADRVQFRIRTACDEPLVPYQFSEILMERMFPRKWLINVSVVAVCELFLLGVFMEMPTRYIINCIVDGIVVGPAVVIAVALVRRAISRKCL